MDRRRFVGLLAGAGLPALPSLALAQWGDPVKLARDDALVREIAGNGRIDIGRVRVTLPVLADNGNAVPLRITVESSMTPAEYVKAVHLVSERNPERRMATFTFIPENGPVDIATRVRLAGSQRVAALAEMSDGSWWIGAASIGVTLSACMDES